MTSTVNDPNRGKLWKSRSKFNIQSIDEVSCEYRRKFANAIKTDIELRCGNDFPAVFYQAIEIINHNKWKHEEMFEYDAKSRPLFCKYKSTDFLDRNIETLRNDPFIHRLLEEQNVDVDSVQSEWISLKKSLVDGTRKNFHQIRMETATPLN